MSITTRPGYFCVKLRTLLNPPQDVSCKVAASFLSRPRNTFSSGPSCGGGGVQPFSAERSRMEAKQGRCINKLSDVQIKRSMDAFSV